MKTDLLVFIIIEGLLFLLCGYALFADIWNRLKTKTSSVTAEVKRGEKSMNVLYVHFGISTVVFTLIVQTCEALKGNQVLFIVVNYALLIYIYFFNSWFRNRLVFSLINRIRKD